MSDHQRRLRPVGGVALFSLCIGVAGCLPNWNGASRTATTPPAPRSTVGVAVGPVQLERRARPVVVVPATSASKARGESQPSPSILASAEVTPVRVLAASPHAPPRILTIHLSTTEISGGEPVSGSVETTSNVASLEARISGWSMPVPRTRIGHFEMTGTIPNVTFFARGTYTLQIIARNADGASMQRDIPITLR